MLRTSGHDPSALAIADFRVLKGYREKIGDDSGTKPIYLKIDCDSFTYDGEGSAAYIDLGSANISPLASASGNRSSRGRRF